MNQRIKLFTIGFALFLLTSLAMASNNGSKDREYWIKTMLKIVDPVFTNLSQNTLRANMPVEVNDGLNNGKRKDVTHLEALGRAFNGIAPWLNLGADETKEGKLRAQYIDLCLKAITNAVDPASLDYMAFDGPGSQPLVDAAFLAQGLLRSKDQIWNKLDKTTQKRIIQEFIASRKIKPYECNWLLFSAMIEAALLEFTGECDMKPVNYAIDKHKEWYVGDGFYGDGPDLHFDYYNSYVIQPMLVDLLSVLKSHNVNVSDFYNQEMKRFVRYAEIQERMISPEGTYPVLGRSSAYRFGNFQVLSQAAYMQTLPSGVTPAQVRSALTKVIKRQISVNGTFDKNGWLQIGFCGHQKEMAEDYVSTGSLYLCTFVFLPLGLDATSDFWTAAPTDWSSVQTWKGVPVKRDKALYD